MNKLLLLLALALPLSGCKMLDVARAVTGSDSGGISTDVTLGDKEQSATVGDRQDIEAEKIEGGINTTNIEDTSPLVLILLVLGWLLPSPQEIWRGFLNMIGMIRGKADVN